jgi:hypothetical protein
MGSYRKDVQARTGVLLKAVSDAFQCPITHEVPLKIVYSKVDGHVYESEKVHQWLQNNNTSPLSREPMSRSDLIEVRPLQNVLPNVHSQLSLLSAPNSDEIVWSVPSDTFVSLRSGGSQNSMGSPELCFQHAEDPRKRYSFKILLYPNGSKKSELGSLGIYFCLQRGPDHTNLEWPMQCDMAITLLHQGIALPAPQTVGGLSTHISGWREYLSFFNPPKANNGHGYGWGTFLKSSEMINSPARLGEELTVAVRMIEV